MDFSSLEHCNQLREVHINQAAESSDAMRALLRRFEQIAAPNKGAWVIVAALARMGTTACADWIDGELRIEIYGDEQRTTISVSSAIGGGYAEKVFTDAKLPVPFEEFRRGIARVPKLVEPLTVTDTGARLVLTATAEVRSTSVPPPAEQGALVHVPRIPAPSVPDIDPKKK